MTALAVGVLLVELLGCLLLSPVSYAVSADADTDIPSEALQVFQDTAVDVTQYIASQQKPPLQTYNGDGTPDLRHMQSWYYIQPDENGDNNHLAGDMWIAAVYLNGSPAGYTSVILNPETNQFEPYMSSPDKAVAQYLETTYQQGGRFAELYRSPLGYFMFKDGMVTPLGDSSTAYIKTTVSEREFFDIIDPIIINDVITARSSDPLAAGGGGSTIDTTTTHSVTKWPATDGSESALMVVSVCLLAGIIPVSVLAWKKRHNRARH